MLVAMATGTGKTFTLVKEIYRLMKSGVAKRVLFLVASNEPLGRDHIFGRVLSGKPF